MHRAMALIRLCAGDFLRYRAGAFEGNCVLIFGQIRLLGGMENDDIEMVEDLTVNCERIFFRNIIRQIAAQVHYIPDFFLGFKYKDEQMITEMATTPYLLKQFEGIDSIINNTMRAHPRILPDLWTFMTQIQLIGRLWCNVST